MSRRERPHEVLGLPPGADRAAIEKAYRRLIKQHHPDKAGGDPESAKAVIQAYRDLSRQRDQLPVVVEAPPQVREPGRRYWPGLAALAGGLFLWLLPWPSAEERRNPPLPPAAGRSDPMIAEPAPSAAAMARVAPDGPAVEAGVEEARRLVRQSPALALRYSRSCAADLDRLPGDALLDHCLAFDLAISAGGNQEGWWEPRGMAERQAALARAVLEDDVLAGARVRAVRLQVERLLVERR
jgi:hypothetical protein